VVQELPSFLCSKINNDVLYEEDAIVDFGLLVHHTALDVDEDDADS